MAFLYGTFSGSAANGRIDPEKLSQGLKWSGSIDHKIRFYSFSGGLILNSVFKTNLSDHLYIDQNEQVLVLVSGYFYNRETLTGDLGSENETLSNPEMAYRLFRQNGKAFANAINGDFIIVIYQKETETVLIWRDHLGARPVSWCLHKKALCFSSDGIELSRVLRGNKKINPQFIYRNFRSSDRADVNQLPLRGARKLEPGSYLEVSTDMLPSVQKFWFPENIKEDSSLQFIQAKNDLRELLFDAVKIRSDLRFTAGTHLSGGLDSGIVAALARQIYTHQKTFYGFSWSSKEVDLQDEGFDERKLVEAIAEKCDIEPIYMKFDIDDFLDLYNSNWKLKDFFHEEILRREAGKKNINLLFSGWGGDEFISINSRGIDSDLFFKLKWKLLYNKYATRNPVHFLKRITLNVFFPAIGISYPFFKEENSKFYNYLLNKKQIVKSDNPALNKWKSRREVHLALLNFGHLAERTEFWFLNGYPAGIEYRYPLLDKRIVEYMIKVPSNILFKNGYVRLMLREISEGLLPKSVTWAKDKSNPVMQKKMRALSKKVFFELTREIVEFKANSELSFIDFAAIEKDVKGYSKDSTNKDIMETLDMMFILKRVHEFSKGYYRN